MISVADIAQILGISTKTARKITREPYEMPMALVRPPKGGRPYLIYNEIDVATRLRHLGKMDAASKIITNMEQTK